MSESLGESSNDERPFEFDQIAEVAFKFENEWTPERNFSIEDALNSIDVCESARLELFTRLLEIDLELGFENRAATPTEEYVRRFPQWKEIVESTSSEIESDFQNAPSSRLGEYVDNYRLDEIIGEGGTGVVYKAFDYVIKRPAAVKFLKKADDHNEERLKLFETEREAMGKIPPGSAFAYAFSSGEYKGVAYLAMEFVEGIDLQRYFQNDDGRRKKAGSLDWREATDYVRQIAAGLDSAHKEGFVHRDVKPANAMLIGKDKIRVLDLGFAGFYGLGNDESENATDSKTVVGTRAFIAPEAKDGMTALDATSDLYSLGGTYLFLLTGIAPSDWFDPFSDAPSVPLRVFLKKKGVKLPSKVVAVLTSLLEPDREKRVQTASDALIALDALLEPSRVFTKTNALVSAVVLLLVGLRLAYSAFGFADEARLKEALKMENQGETTRAFDLMRDRVRPEKLSDVSQFQYWRLQTCGLIETGSLDDARKASVEALQTFEDIPESKRPPEWEFDARVLEVQALTLSGEKELVNNYDVAASFLKQACDKGTTFLEKRVNLNAKSKKAAATVTANVLYWRARSYWGLGRARGDVDFALADLRECLEYNPDYPDARKLRGDLYYEKALRADSPECRKSWIEKAVDEYQSALERPDATDGEIRETLCQIITAFELVDDRLSVLKVCKQLSQLNSKLDFAAFHRGKNRLLEALASSPKNVDRSTKDDILKDLRLAVDESDLSSEERGEIWLAYALAALKLGDVSKEDCERSVDAISQALKTNAKQSFFVFNGTEWNVFGLRRAALEKLREFCDSEDERRELDDKIRNDARKEFESLKRGRTTIVSEPLFKNEDENVDE